ncbi:hypothetical protein IFM89_026305 [Coptis chinensis]|uniref:Ubiquinol oxidase n=1 Tax=Coptis chinensis TaxID=261450 RepID=A0A835I5V6_9MAGN|nr:hypothetical protein IFM89_026305 [Coptis chinensis]
MALPLSSSSIITFPTSSSSRPIPIKALVSLHSQKPLFSSLRHSASRKLSRVQATVLEENEEKVVVEETFQPHTFPANEEKSESSSPGGTLERWAIKVEQTINIALTDSVIKILDVLYNERDYPRFFVLETIARVPYFAFMSVLHMYESFGWWRRADYLKVHFAESWNEMHHLLIMEELGGNAWWFDRFLAQHIAVFYYFMTAFMYLVSPRMAFFIEYKIVESQNAEKNICDDMLSPLTLLAIRVASVQHTLAEKSYGVTMFEYSLKPTR